MRKNGVDKCKIITLSENQVREREDGVQLLKPLLLNTVPRRLCISNQDQVKYAGAAKKAKHHIGPYETQIPWLLTTRSALIL